MMTCFRIFSIRLPSFFYVELDLFVPKFAGMWCDVLILVLFCLQRHLIMYQICFDRVLFDIYKVLLF